MAKKMKRKNISSGAQWEDIVGYSRAVRVGHIVEVAGTTSAEGKGEYEQTKLTIQKIEAALKEAGAELSDVVRTRIYVTNISKWEEVGRAHGEFFRTIKPATAMVEVKALISPEILVEIEATAILNS
jgi:enamine deaminase RidA (YjgF/YER057c/UK114 family)